MLGLRTRVASGRWPLVCSTLPSDYFRIGPTATLSSHASPCDREPDRANPRQSREPHSTRTLFGLQSPTRGTARAIAPAKSTYPRCPAPVLACSFPSDVEGSQLPLDGQGVTAAHIRGSVLELFRYSSLQFTSRSSDAPTTDESQRVQVIFRNVVLRGPRPQRSPCSVQLARGGSLRLATPYECAELL